MTSCYRAPTSVQLFNAVGTQSPLVYKVNSKETDIFLLSHFTYIHTGIRIFTITWIYTAILTTMQMSGNSIARKVHGISAVTVNSRILLLRAMLFYLFGREFVQESPMYTSTYVFQFSKKIQSHF